MIVEATVEATGYRKERTKHDRENGIYAHSTIQENVEFSLEIEFVEGYVNLEAYAVDSYGLNFHDHFGRFFPEFERFDDIEVEDYEISIWGSSNEWVEQAETWVSERPDHDVRSALSKFRNWDETKTEDVNRAIEEFVLD